MINYNFKMTKEKSLTETIVYGIIYVILLILLVPFLSFWLGYFMGWLSKIMIGSYIVSAFNLIHIQINADQIPLIGGLIGWIGCFFTGRNTKNDD